MCWRRPPSQGAPAVSLTATPIYSLPRRIAVAAVAGYTVVMTLILLTLLDRLMGLRVSAEDEELGLDLTQHGQRGYMMGEGELIGIVPK